MVTDYFPPHVGGVERAVYELSRRLVACGQRVTVLTLNTNGASAHEFVEGIEVIRLPCLDLTGALRAQLTVSLSIVPRIAQLLATRSFDLVHVHCLILLTSLPVALAARIFGLPLVATAQTGSTSAIGGVQGGMLAVYERTMGMLILKLSGRIIAVSRAVAAHTRRLGGSSDDTVVIPNGVDTQVFRPAAPDEGPPRIVFVGRLIFNKGPGFLVDALPSVLRRFPETRVDFIGDGPMQAELARRVDEMGFAEKVRFLGDRDDVPLLLRAGDIMVRPSLLEGLPLAVLEGMAAGLAIVATPVGGTAEIVLDGVTGYLVRPSDAEQLAERLCDLLADADLRRAMGERGRALVERAYDWDGISRRTLALYRQLLGGVAAGDGRPRSR